MNTAVWMLMACLTAANTSPDCRVVAVFPDSTHCLHSLSSVTEALSTKSKTPYSAYDFTCRVHLPGEPT
jgi:hypothetical protein